MGITGFTAIVFISSYLPKMSKKKQTKAVKDVSESTTAELLAQQKEGYDVIVGTQLQQIKQLTGTVNKLKGLKEREKRDAELDEDELEEEELTSDDILEQYDINFEMAGNLAKTMKLPAGISNMITPETIKNPAVQQIAMKYLADNPDYLEMAIKYGVLVPKGTIQNEPNNQPSIQSPSSEQTQPTTLEQLGQGSA